MVAASVEIAGVLGVVGDDVFVLPAEWVARVVGADRLFEVTLNSPVFYCATSRQGKDDSRQQERQLEREFET
jgi:hypothetical protein